MNLYWQLEALDLSRNNLFAIEKDVLHSLTMLKALYLGGNPFNCHCGLSWINASLGGVSSYNQEQNKLMQDRLGQDISKSIKVVDIQHIYCRTDSDTTRAIEGEKKKLNKNNIVLLSDISHKFADECEPYIIPLFISSNVDEMMGKNISWLCKALGSDDIDLLWRLPRRMPSHQQYKVTQIKCVIAIVAKIYQFLRNIL